MMRVLITRPRKEADEFAHLLGELGAEAIFFPTIAICPVKDTSALDRAISHLQDYDWLILTSAKNLLFCESQGRELPSLRRQAMDPEVELHPQAAAERGIHPGDWVYLETPEGRVRARARLNETLKPDVVCGQHGWWQACPEVGAPGYDPFSSEGANFNLLIGNDAIDPVSGSVPHRAYLCQIHRAE